MANKNKGQYRRRKIRKKPFMEKRSGLTFNVKNKVIIGYEEICQELGLDRNDLAETILMNFILDVKGAKQNNTINYNDKEI